MKRLFENLRYATLIFCIFCLNVMLFGACAPNNNSDRQRVEIVAFHPISKERVENYGWYELNYTGAPQRFTVKVLSLSRNIYLDNDELSIEGKSLLYFGIRTDGNPAFTDEGIDDWPSERGLYDVIISFNDDPLCENLEYYSASLVFTIKIV